MTAAATRKAAAARRKAAAERRTEAAVTRALPAPAMDMAVAGRPPAAPRC